jgi:short-subunit dehydrogenase
MKVFAITGASSFIGQHLVRHLFSLEADLALFAGWYRKQFMDPATSDP